MVGSILAKHNSLVDRVKRMRRSSLAVFFIAALLCYTFRNWGPDLRMSMFIVTPLSGLASGAFILISLSSNWLIRTLRMSPMLVVGRASYSLYLVHALILIAVAHIFRGKIMVSLLITIALTCTGLATWMLYRFVEIPTIALGRRLREQKV